MTKRIAVVGGGLGGLVAARRLIAAGHDAHVLEAAAHVGGVLATSRADGFVREHAASSFLGGPPRGALALCRELAVAVEPAAAAARRRWVFLDGKLRELPRDPLALVRSDLLTWRGKLALLREPLRAARGAHGDESMHAFAARRFGVEAARAIVAPMVTGVFAADAHDISAEAGFPRLVALDREGGIVRGSLVRAGRAAIARLRGRAVAATPRGLYAPVGGLGALIDALAESLVGRLRCATRVRAIVPVAGGVAIDGERWDGCVLAVPAEDGAALVDAALPELASRLRAFHRAPAAIVYLGLPRAAVPRAADGFGFLVARGEDVRVLGVVFESTVWPDRAPADQLLLRCIFGGGRDPEAAQLSAAELIAVARRDVGRVLGVAPDVAPTHASAIAWPRGIAQYRVGHRDRVREAEVGARAARIALAGADYRGVAVNELCADADAVVAEVSAW